MKINFAERYWEAKGNLFLYLTELIMDVLSKST